MDNNLSIRPLQSQDDYAQCVALQYEIWGADFGECAPPSLLLATQQVSGIAAGAFDSEGRLLGFVFGIGGQRQGRSAHWSDMLGVREDCRGYGVGQRLKLYQRRQLLMYGIELAYWSYDPLEARNAHLNINRLGALPIEYVRDMYGDASSPLHAGLGTDRFIVEWQLEAPHVEAALAGKPRPIAFPAGAPVVNSRLEAGKPQPRSPDLPGVSELRIEVPADIQETKSRSPQEAAAWRDCTRVAISHYVVRGYRIVGFERDLENTRCFYLFAQPISESKTRRSLEHPH